jgi:hypothetical protein
MVNKSYRTSSWGSRESSHCCPELLHGKWLCLATFSCCPVFEECTPGVEDEIFATIISMCSGRILCRLQFVANSRKTPRQPIKGLLEEAINSIQQLENETAKDSKLLAMVIFFIDRAKEVMKLVDAWVNQHTPARLEKLVEGIHHLRRAGELQTMLNIIPNRAMDPTSMKPLPCCSYTTRPGVLGHLR